ncbi:uncharacterized protein LOC112603100 [Melanaphis sacchari]|uniref:uncharacterized protein LOC112603100 n=1 Tax=Melanaphis sacchari TaxID=742174 RepID=UPI000DC12D8E|nr:uncharacterized protein LOC112603100 [Melanaphis sacchari]
MTTVFHFTLRTILIFSKCIGLIDTSYTMEPAGLLVRNNMNSTLYAYLEIIRMIVLIISTYIYFFRSNPEIYIVQSINIIKFWIIIITARQSTIQLIKFINGVIEFDRKITPLLTNLSITQRSWTKKKWNLIFITLFAYFVVFKTVQIYIFPKNVQYIASFIVVQILFSPPFLIDFVVTISACFFLQNLYVRFQTLNDIWKCLPADLVVVFDKWTHDEIVDVMENTRLLHSELCELLKMFTLGYGPLLLSFFTFDFINMLLSFYFIINSEALASIHLTKNSWENIMPLMIHIQILTFLMSIIVFVSFLNEQRLEIISCLRSYRISNLHLDIKRQIKMFMNQISACDSDQISASGFFNINLNLIISMIVLMVSGIITLIQMKDHPIILKFNNDTENYLGKLYTTK